MWKVSIFILCAFVCCNNPKSKGGSDKIDCIPLLDNVLDSVYLSQYKRDNKHVILCVFFYTIDTSKFLSITPAPCVQKLSKSYLEYKSYLIDYVGIDDAAANLVLPLDKFKTDYPIEGYNSWNDYPEITWDVQENTYLICGKDSLTPFHPDKEHELILWDIFEREGFLVPPPIEPSQNGIKGER